MRGVRRERAGFRDNEWVVNICINLEGICLKIIVKVEWNQTSLLEDNFLVDSRETVI